MQDINEAYLILKDYEARSRYDIEFEKYKSFQNSVKETESKNQKYDAPPSENKTNTRANEAEYHFDDEILKKWMRNAREQAVDLAIQTIKEIGQLSVVASKAAGIEILRRFFWFFIAGWILFFAIKACEILI